MPVFKCFLKIMNKNKGMLIMYMAIFVGLSLILTNANATRAESLYKDTALPIAVIDRDESELSKALSAYLDERHSIAELPDEEEALQDALFNRDVTYILFVPEGFEADFIKDAESASLENVKLPDSASGVYLDNQIDRYISTLKTYLWADYTLTDALANTSTDLKVDTDVVIAGGTEESVSGVVYYFHIMPYILLSIISSVLGPMLIAFNKEALLRRTESSSLKLLERNTQIALGCAVSSLLMWGILIVTGFVMYREEMFTSVSALRIVNSLVFLVVSTCIGFLIGQLTKNTNALSAVTNVVGLGMSFLCGIFVSQNLLGEGVLTVAKFLPAYWYIRNNDLLTSTAGLNTSDMSIYGEGILIQLGFALAIFAVALVVSRQKKLNPAA